LLHGKQAVHTHAMTANQPYLMAISRRYDMTRLWMNKGKGGHLGLKDGDWVQVLGGNQGDAVTIAWFPKL